MAGDPCCPAATVDLTREVRCTCGHTQINHLMGHPHVCLFSQFHNSNQGPCDCEGFTDKSPWPGLIKEAGA